MGKNRRKKNVKESRGKGEEDNRERKDGKKK